MSEIYEAIMSGFKEIGQRKHNDQLVEHAEFYLNELKNSKDNIVESKSIDSCNSEKVSKLNKRCETQLTQSSSCERQLTRLKKK